MSINFNFGEHFYDTGSFWVSVLISFIGAFFGFLFALLINRHLEKKKEKKQEEKIKSLHIERLRYLELILKSTVKTVTKQVIHYSEFGKQVKINPLKSFRPVQIASYDLWRLRNLDSIELFDSYSNQFIDNPNKTKNYKNIFGHGDFLLEKLTEVKKQNERHRDFKHKDELFIRDCVENIFTLIGIRCKNYRLKFGDNASQIPEFLYLTHFESIYKSISQGTADFDKIRNEYFLPLHKTLLDNIVDINFADSIFPIVKSALSRLKHIEFNADEFASDMEEIDNDTKESIEFLKKQGIEIQKKIEP